VGTWAAIAACEAPKWLRRFTDAVFHLPIAVPSVAIGLGLLIAFNSRPLLLGGTRWIVILTHTALVLAFAFSAVSAALDRLDAAYRQAAESLGAGSVRVLVRITLPLLLPALGAAAGLAVALSMGELGATVMVYPATWKTLPVTIFGLTDRGQVFQAAASTTLLLAVTLLALMVLGRIRGRAALR
jgi:2-aminoethylphosphonate transport system permease protein